MHCKEAIDERPESTLAGNVLYSEVLRRYCMSQNLTVCPQEGARAAVIADLYMLAELFSMFLENAEPDVWQQRGQGVQASEWTLHQTVSHLTAAAEFYHSVLRCALNRETLVTPGFQRRQDLPHVNQREIQQRQHMLAEDLIAALTQALVRTADLAQQMTPEQFSWSVTVPVFNRSLTIFELLEMQVAHPGMVHAAQVTRPLGRAPLWREYEEAVLYRMLTRFFRLMSLIYWPERGGKLRTVLRFLVAGPAGGAWHLTVAPEQCWSEEGRGPKPRVTLRAASADALCQVFTGQITPVRALLTRKLFVLGDIRLAFKIDSLFSPI
jgi:hypothetical protein